MSMSDEKSLLASPHVYRGELPNGTLDGGTLVWVDGKKLRNVEIPAGERVEVKRIGPMTVTIEACGETYVVDRDWYNKRLWVTS